MAESERSTREGAFKSEVRHVEDLDDELADILTFARERGDSYRATPGRVTTKNAAYPDVTDLITRRLRADLEDEIVAARVPDERGHIRLAELNRDVIMKALVGLRANSLKRIAAASGLMTSLNTDRLAESIANAYGWDEDAIARLVLENEDYVRADRGFSTRLFPLHEAPSVDRVSSQLDYVRGRYIRTGLARWFVFVDANETEDSLEVSGTLRTYDASIDDRVIDKPRLSATVASDTSTRVLIHESDLLEVRNSPVGAARASVAALETVTELEPLYRVPFIDASAPAVVGELHGASRFMVDLLVNRLPGKGLGQINLTVARFKMREEATDPWDTESTERRSTVKAVRFEGDYLLGSVPACQLLAIQQRPLTDMTFHVVVRNRDRIIVGRYPVRITIDHDHVAVETGYGGGNKEVSASVHSQVTQCVVDEIRHGFGNEERLIEFEGKVRARAEADDLENPTDLLSDEDSPNSTSSNIHLGLDL